MVRDGVRLEPLIHGGGQERERRSGTHNVAGSVGMAAALAAIDRRRAGDGRSGSARCVTDWWTAAGHGDRADRDGRGRARCRASCMSASAGVESEALVVAPDEAGVAASAGAACSSGAVEPSHVLEAMGLGRGGGRGRYPVLPRARTTDAEVDHVLAVGTGRGRPAARLSAVRVLVAMSGGVDSSVAAALMAEQFGRDAVVGATLKLWGGSSDSGCCSVADVEDARRVADQLGWSITSSTSRTTSRSRW